MSRPNTPPFALTWSKYAFAPCATTAYADSGPEIGAVPPITISSDETPGSAASAPGTATTAAASSAEREPQRETAFASTGMRTASAPSVTRAPAGIGRSR